MSKADIAKIVDIHLASFKGFFLSFLGKAFLRELYLGILADPSGIAFIAENEGNIQGFVVGTDTPREIYKRLFLQRWLRFALASVGPALRNPGIILRLLRAYSRGEREDMRENYANLMSIAVLPNMQREGIGQLLVREFLKESMDRKVDGVNLTTDKNNNESTNLFYQQLGFRLATSFRTPEGREMNEYELCIEPTHNH